MEFHKALYLEEMKSMVIQAIQKLKKEQPEFEIFTASIWTDPNAAASSIGFESKANSDKCVQSSDEWNKKYYDQYMAEGDIEQARLFEPTEGRNDNPADFELRDFVEIENSTIDENWEDTSDGECWDVLEPALKEVGEFAFAELRSLNLANEFELSVNGREDWYQFVWRENQ